ncbi:MAG: tetratricopeptide repeat protein [Acidobacteria bacterium]|nr:MAG: tetratricopeptide repeat protein [Acidobacteriota bacterium]
MDRYTRHQLKQDDFSEKMEALQIFAEEHLKQIIIVCAAVIVVAGGAWWIKSYYANQEAIANTELQAAITTFHAYVGSSQQGALMGAGDTYPTAEVKYQKALVQFSEVVQKHPRTKAGGYALIQMGVCQSQLGNDETAIKTLQNAGRNSDKEIASQAQFALAGVLAKTGKSEDAARVYQNLADHPTTIVPRATALLAMADVYRASQPNRAREIYEQVQKEYGSDTVVAESLKQQLATLPQ